MWTQEDLDAVQQALASGEKSVTFADGRKLEYQNTGELLKLRTQIKSEIAANNPALPVRRATVARMGVRR